MLQSSGLKIRALNELIKSSGILFLASLFANICNLLFWLFMVRMLSPVEYGVLNALFSLFMILSLPAGTMQTVVTKFVAQFYGMKEFAHIKYFSLHLGKLVFMIAILFLLVFILFSQVIADFLKISSVFLVILTGLILFVSIISPLTFGILQGTQRFLALSVNGILGSSLKLILGAVLVVLGFKVMGALIGFGLAAVLTLTVSIFQIPREIAAAPEDSSAQLKMNSVYLYSLPVLIGLFSWMVLTNGDVILVKHFFSPEDAGFYSVAQMVGKIILFLPGVIGFVLFPKISEAFGQQRPSLHLLKKGLVITAFLCVMASIFCSLFPGLVLRILTRKEMVESVKLVPLFCAAMTFYALAQQFMGYNLAIQRYRFIAYLLLAAIAQLSLIYLFHPNLSSVVLFLTIISASLFSVGCWEAFISKDIA